MKKSPRPPEADNQCLTLLIKEKTLSFKEIGVSFKSFDLENIFWILQYLCTVVRQRYQITFHMIMTFA